MIICRHETWNNISTPLLQEICQHKCQHDKRLAINLQGQVFHLWVRLKVCKYHRKLNEEPIIHFKTGKLEII